VLDEIKGRLAELKHPETGEPLVSHVHERDDLYHGPHSATAPDLTVVLGDWRYRTIGLYDFTTHRVISPAFGPTGDHRMEGVFIGVGPAFRAGARLGPANLLDVAPTALRVLGVPVPADMDGRVLDEVLDPSLRRGDAPSVSPGDDAAYEPQGYSADEEAVIQQRLADLGYL
jgi:predicted AlkP superfamily phosphohydrolase/phosphomutase